MKKQIMRISSLIIFAICAGAVFVFSAAAGEDPAENAVRAQARNVVAGLRGAYGQAALRISPARLPDTTDYLLDRPAGFDFQVPLDSFKQSYCKSIPAGATLKITWVGRVSLSDTPSEVKKSGVLIAGPALLSSVKKRVADFRPSTAKNRYDYTVKITRKAGVGVEAGGVIFDLTFAETADEWLLYDIRSRRRASSKAETAPPEIMKFTPYYQNCGRE
jgi:hypothetical protein